MSEIKFPKEMACFAHNYTPGINLYEDLRPECPLGFFCPNVTATNYISSPRQCPASKECGIKRLQGLNCDPQGPYEPVLCEHGYYCPNHYTKIICPRGFYCPIGRYEPIKCNGIINYCPEGSSKFRVFDGFVLLVILDTILVIVYFVIKNKRRQRTIRKDMERNIARIAAKEKHDLESSPPESKSNLLDFYKKGLKGRRLEMEFNFQNMGLKLPNGGKVILQGVSGEIKSSRMTAIMGPSGAGSKIILIRNHFYECVVRQSASN